MTINKRHGQTLSNVGLYLPRPVFSPGQLYVALFRVKTRTGMKVLISCNDVEVSSFTPNVMYLEVFLRI